MRSVTQMIARNPRFKVTRPWSFKVKISRSIDELQVNLPADLEDLSRQGFCIRINADLFEGEEILVRIELAEAEGVFESAAVVQWAALVGEHAVMAGCRFRREIDLEILGEFFLTNALSPLD